MRRRRPGPGSCPGTRSRFWPPRVSDATASWSAPSCVAVDTIGRRARRRPRLAVGGGRLPGSARAGRAGRSCAHAVGAASARRAGARRRRDDRRGRGATRRRGRAAGTAPLHLGVQHDGSGGAGLARPSTATRRRRVASAAQSVGRSPVARGHPRRLRGRGGPVDIRLDDRGAGPSGEPAAAAATPGPSRGGQRQPQGRSVRGRGGVDRSRRRDRASGSRSGSPSPTANTSNCVTARTIPGSRSSSLATTWSSCSTSRWTTRCGTPGRTPRSPCRPSPVDETVDLVVSDDGPGLPDEDLSRAAARFWRGHDDSAGTGLGLAIAGEIAAGHGGAIAVERAPEGGLLVRYSLPVGKARHADRPIDGMSRRDIPLRDGGAWPLAACAAGPADACAWPPESGAGCTWRSRSSWRSRSRPATRTSAST